MEENNNITLSFDSNAANDMHVEDVNQGTMEEATHETLLEFDSPKDQSSYIKVIGVGGGGSNAVNHMYRQGIKGVDFIVCNTDRKALNSSPVPNKLILGELGAGGRPEVGCKAAWAHKEEIKEILSHNTQMLFITAGMGGGTGTGAAPVIAEIAKEVEIANDDIQHILVVAIVTMPFRFEQRKKTQLAIDGIEELKKHVDSIIIINNDKLRDLGGNMPLHDAFKHADDVLLTAAKGIAEIITVSAYVNIDFHDVNTIMSNSGTALMGSGVGAGENRAQLAIKEATESPLLNDNSIAGATGVLLYIAYSSEHPATMDEFTEITEYVEEITDADNATVIWGDGIDETLGEKISVTLIATGFEGANKKKVSNTRTVTPLEPVHPIAPTPVVDTPVVAEVPNPGTKVVIPLDDEYSKVLEEMVNPTDKFHNANTSTVEQTNEVETMVLDPEMEPRLISPKEQPEDFHHEEPETHHTAEMHLDAAPIFAPQPAPVETPMDFNPAPMPETKHDNQINNLNNLSRIDRIKALHAMLRNNPNGAQMAESLNPSELTGCTITETIPSNAKTATQTKMDDSGNILGVNNFLYNNPD